MDAPTIGSGYLQQLEQQQYAASAPPVPPPTILDQASTEYPILKGLGLQFKKSAPDPNGSLLEYWPSGETGTNERPRPKEFDLKKPGVEVYSDKVRPIDILGDAVSHHMIETDPTIGKIYSAFEQSVTPEQNDLLRQQYTHAQVNEGEKRSFNDWRETTGIPAFFRGYPFQQWPEEFNQRVYTPKQIQLLDGMMNYLRGGK